MKSKILKSLEKVSNVENMFEVTEKLDLVITTCENEYLGDENENFDTYQISVDEDDDYFGEFIHDKISDEITLNIY